MVGVLTVIAVLGTVGLAPAMSYYRQLARDREQQTLTDVAQALRLSVMRELIIPSETNFAAQIARYSGQSTANVLVNARGNTRLLLIDPGVTNCGFDLPFNQTVSPLEGAGTGSPANLRMLLISSVGVAFTNGLPAAPGGKPNATVFSNLWATPSGKLPAGVTWAGDPSDLCFQRIQFLDLLHPVSFNHAEVTGGHTNGKIRLPGLTALAAPSGAPSPSTRWFLQGTTIVLSNAADQSTFSEIVTGPVSFTYEKGFWTRGLGDLTKGSAGLSRITGADFEAAVRAFLASATVTNLDQQGRPIPGPGDPGTAQAIVNAMSNYIQLGALGPANANAMRAPVASFKSALLDYTGLPLGQFNKP
jgi:hypothetical protein